MVGYIVVSIGCFGGLRSRGDVRIMYEVVSHFMLLRCPSMSKP